MGRWRRSITGKTHPDAATILRKIVNGPGYVDLDAGIIDYCGDSTLRETLTGEELAYLRTLEGQTHG